MSENQGTDNSLNILYVYNSMIDNIPEFKQFVSENKNKSIEEISIEYSLEKYL